MNSLNRFADPFYCITRLIVGLMFASHGGQLVLGMFGGMPGSDRMMMQVGGWIQLVGGLLIAFGLFTRLAAFICSGAMAVAYFMIHVANAPTLTAKFFPISSAAPQFSNKGELAIYRPHVCLSRGTKNSRFPTFRAPWCARHAGIDRWQSSSWQADF